MKKNEYGLSTLEKILFLSQVEIFSAFSVEDLGNIAVKTREVAYSKGDIIFRQGDVGDSLYIIVGGKVKVIREDKNLREVIAILEEKSCFGEMAILSDMPRSATVESADVTTLLKISKKDFRELILKNPEMAFPIFKILIEKIKSTTDLYMEKVKS